MNKLIEELAMNSGIYDCIIDPYDSKGNGDNQSSIMVDLVRFAALVAAAEREACAAMVERGMGDWRLGKKVAAAIRARGEK